MAELITMTGIDTETIGRMAPLAIHDLNMAQGVLRDVGLPSVASSVSDATSLLGIILRAVEAGELVVAVKQTAR